ncbi:TetR/AcrR family transcriptional regulator [Amycolatopsis rhabdoformis]|uniref:TetR/AcrR family transcriptional regulator n=1 Tax=Amycolatopsis rhabdoformis TaxID=1448059 RepID=A0ABZ1I962_9PSEU|nr:TetR/AcrR family transcriptional regulator [Amycolatopsis rhabdoformis]WSE30128.1 TetR/AcrR family transcriptional regulator [Amycolatopsis rhabdoformis]
MAEAAPGRPGRPARWSRDDIVEAAGRIVTTEGVDALTMRRVARELGCSPMALYRHVRDKDELLLLLLDHTAATLPRPTLPEDPRRRLVVLWRQLHDALAEHPWVVGVLAQGDLAGPSVLWLVEEILTGFVASGLAPRQAAAAYRIVWQYTVGVLTIRHATTTRAAEHDQDAPQVQRTMILDADPAELPLISSLSGDWPHAWDNYAAGLDALLDGLLPRA